ncbi:MAG TPA: hypothetical protein VGK30_09290 [Candidatus Binatia bacterium]|jgi:hypothetical protein
MPRPADRLRPPPLAQTFIWIILVELFALAVRATVDPDMWWHLRMGELIATEGIPHHDTFSFTAAGHEIVAHEWGSQLMMWGIYSIAGLWGLSLVFALVPTLALWLVSRACGGPPYLAGTLVALGAWAASPWFGVKPQLFNVLFLALFVLILTRASERRRLTYLLALPPLTAVWANLHSGYLVGVALLLVHVVGDAFDLRLGREPRVARTDRELRLMIVIALACMAAALLNPNGVRLVRYAVETLRTPAFQQHIAEWRSPEFRRPAYWGFGAMLALSAVVLTYAPRRPAATEALLVLGTAAAALTSVRHIPLFAVVGTPVLMVHLREILERAPRRSVTAALLSPGGSTGWTGPIALAAAVAFAVVLSTTRIGGNADAVAGTYPVAAVDFLTRTGLGADHGYNPYDWGGYLIWRRIPVFVDGRADVYGEPFFVEQLKVALGTPDWSAPLDKHGCTYALVQRNSVEAALLAGSSRWCERYQDALARVYVRCDASASR